MLKIVLLLTLILLLAFIAYAQIEVSREKWFADDYDYALQSGIAAGGGVITDHPYPGLGWVN